MPTVVVRGGILPQQVDDFPDGCERSCKGSLHLKPGTMIVTDGELAHIQKSRPELGGYLQVVSRTRPAKAVTAPDDPPNDPPDGTGDDPPVDPPEESGDDPPPETVTEIPGSTEEDKPPKRKKRRGFPDAH